MNSISWQDAFLILKKWRDESTLFVFSEVINWEGEPCAAGSPAVIKSVDDGSGTVETSNGKAELLGAEFSYSGGPSDSPFADSPDEFACTLAAELPNGRSVVFSELKRQPRRQI